MKWVRDRFSRARGALAVRELVDRVIDHYRLDADLRLERLFSEWPTWVGGQVGARTRPETIVDRTLIVEVATSTWLQELRLLRPKIVSDVLDRLGMPRLFDDIRFVLTGERRRGAPVRRPKPRAAPPAARPAPAPASGAALEQIIRDASRVEDDDLRSLIAAVRIRHDK